MSSITERPNGRVEATSDQGGVVPTHIDELLVCVLEMDGSDLHLTAGAKPTVRVHGELLRVERFAVLTSEQIERLVNGILTDRQIRAFEQEMELDAAHSIGSRSRFRMNVFRQRGRWAPSCGRSRSTFPHSTHSGCRHP